MVKNILHVEGLAISLTSFYILFFYMGVTWWLMPVFLLGPDISMLGYLHNKRTGANLYNLGHTFAVAIPLTLLGVLAASDPLFITGLILTGHIGMDRFFGFGLKYPTHFKETHMGRV